ncbi:MAG: flagellar basal body-associated FliL family protein [Syntrophomonadaceae bacterium]|nr:flagellar basal body-associated FliL family protein [Bacillota bacterium]NLP25529.1 flagellar basal body protein FliL [Syntrophomonadaceae bacterium]
MSEEKPAEVTTKKSDLRIIVIGLVFFLVAMAGTYFFISSMMAPLLPEKESEKAETATGNLVSIGEFTTNVNDVAGSRFLRVEVYVEVSKEDKKNQEIINEAMPIIKDTILSIMSSKTVADLDVRNRDNLKAEIKNELNKKIGSKIIQNVYFTSFIMQ